MTFALGLLGANVHVPPKTKASSAALKLDVHVPVQVNVPATPCSVPDVVNRAVPVEVTPFAV